MGVNDRNRAVGKATDLQASAHICVTTQSQVEPVHMNTPPGICVARGGAQGKGGSCRCLCHLIVMAESLAADGSPVL